MRPEPAKRPVAESVHRSGLRFGMRIFRLTVVRPLNVPLFDPLTSPRQQMACQLTETR